MKLKHMLPITAIVGAATVTMPIAASCSNSKIVSTKMETVGEIRDDACLRTEELSFDESTIYKVTFKWSDCQKISGVTDTNNGWKIRCTDADWSDTNVFRSVKLYLDGKRLTAGDDFKAKDLSIFPLKPLNLNEDSTFRAEFKIKCSVKKGYVWLSAD